MNGTQNFASLAWTVAVIEVHRTVPGHFIHHLFVANLRKANATLLNMPTLQLLHIKHLNRPTHQQHHTIKIPHARVVILDSQNFSQ